MRHPAAAAALLALVLSAAPAAAQGASALVYVKTGPINVGTNQETGGNATCPPGTQVTGGGALVSGLGLGSVFPFVSEPSGPTTWTVSASNADDLHNYSFEGEAACAPAPSLAGWQNTADSVTLDARFKPGGHDQGTAIAYCPGGTQVIGGGFFSENATAIAIISTGPNNPAANGWSVTAKNFANLSSNSFSAGAICIATQMARGLLAMHYVEEKQSVSQGTVRAPCSFGGLALSGGATASGASGAFESLSFAPNQYAYELFYSSGKAGKGTVAALVACGDVTPYLGPLTAPSFQLFCEQEFQDEPRIHAIEGKGALDWECVWEGGSYRPGGQIGQVCEHAFPLYFDAEPSPKAVYLNVEDPLSWGCWAPEEEDDGGEGPGVGETLSAVASEGESHGLGSSQRDMLTIRGAVRLPRRIGLASTRVGVRHLLLERSARGELVRRKGGGDASPLMLRSRHGGRPGRRVVYRGGSKPRVKLTLTRRRGRVLRFALRVSGGRVHKPLLCGRGRRGRTDLTTRFRILRKRKPLADVTLSDGWECNREALAIDTG